MSKEVLSLGLKGCGYDDLMILLETLQDYEISDEILREKLVREFRKSIPVMYNYMDVFFKLSGFSEDTCCMPG